MKCNFLQSLSHLWWILSRVADPFISSLITSLIDHDNSLTSQVEPMSVHSLGSVVEDMQAKKVFAIDISFL